MSASWRFFNAEAFANSEHVVEGEFEMGSQYHFYMETQVALSVPTDDGIDLFCSSQDGDNVQVAAADCLRLQKSQCVSSSIRWSARTQH